MRCVISDFGNPRAWRRRIRSPLRHGFAARRAWLSLRCCSVRRCPVVSLAANDPTSTLICRRPIAKRGRGAPDAHVPALDWWRGFRSNELTTLMDAAQLYNLDVAVAIAQIVQADAQAGVAGAPLLPAITGTSTAEQVRSVSSNFGGGNGFATTFLAVQPRAHCKLHDRFLGQEPRHALCRRGECDRGPIQPRSGDAHGDRDRRQQLFPDPRRTGQPARRPTESRGGRAHFDTHQAAVCRRHRIAARRIATGGAGRHRTRCNSAP